MSGLSYHHIDASELPDQWLEALLNRFGTNQGTRLDPAAACLTVLLDALGWEGSARKLIEAAPFQDTPLDPEDLRNTLARLGFRSIELSVKRDQITDRLCPCLVLKKDGVPAVVLGRDENGFRVFDGAQPTRTQSWDSLETCTVYVIEKFNPNDRAVPVSPGSWLRQALKRFRGVLGATLWLTFFINLLALIVPLSIMAIYDQVIGKDSVDMLKYLIIGVLGASAFEVTMRILRARIQAYAGARIDYLVSSQVFNQILHLPPSFTERASVSGQVTRIREFEAFRELFSGAVATLILDLPFILIFVAAISFIAGPLAVIPIVLAVFYAILGYLVFPTLKDHNKDAGDKRSRRHAFLIELMWWMRSVKQQGGEGTWRDRFRAMSADASWANLKVSRLNGMAQDIAQTLMILAGTATLAFGVLRAMDGAMSLGALIATMMLVWRILSPIQTLFGLFGRIGQTQQSLRQLLSILAYDRELDDDGSQLSTLSFSGHIRFDRVSMRYTSEGNPALLGLSFSAAPGEMIGIVGDSGSGKSTIAKLIMGLYSPQAGAVTLDGIDIRQMKPILLRQTLAYVPQHNHALPGSLLENIRVADPTASLEDIENACRKSGIWDKIQNLPNGLNTHFKDGLQAHVPQGFLRQLALARCFLRDAPVFVLDEPGSGLDHHDEQALIETLKSLRGQKTVIMITQRPSHMKLCDKLLTLDHGQMEFFGKTDAVLAERDKARSASPAAPEKRLDHG